MPVGDVDRLTDVAGRPFARAPVERLALRDHVAHRPHRLFQRRVGVGAVAIHDVDEVEPEAFERRVDGLCEVLAVECVAHVHAVGVNAPEELGRDEVRPTRPAELGQRLTHDLLALASGVGLCVVEEVAAGVVGGLHALECHAGVELSVERDPAAEAEHAHLHPGVAEPAVFHSRCLGHAADHTDPAPVLQCRSPSLADRAADLTRCRQVGSSRKDAT